MKSIVDLAQTRLQDVRVNLRRRQVRVPEHCLNGAQIGAALEQMRRKRVPQHVRTQMRANARAAAVRLQQFPEAEPREPAAIAAVDEQPRAVAPSCERAASLC